MAKINKALCAQDYGNSGFGDCYLDLDEIIGGMQVTRDFRVTEAQVADFMEYLKTLVHAPIGSRIFPYQNFINLTDNTEDETIASTDYGAKYVTTEGDYDLSFRYLIGGIQVHNEIQKNAGENKYFILFAKNGAVLFYRSGKDLVGIPTSQFIVPKWRFPTGAEKIIMNLRLIFKPIYLNKGNLGFLKPDFNMFDIKGLEDIELEVVSQVANQVTVRAVTKIADQNLFATYGVKLASVAAWRSYDESDSSAISIVSVTANADAGPVDSKGGWDIVLNPTTILAMNPGDKFSISLAPASVLFANPFNIEGFENKPSDRLILEIEEPAS